MDAVMIIRLSGPLVGFTLCELVDRAIYGTWFKRWRWNLVLSMVSQIVVQSLVYLGWRIVS